jgi:hypothetical protein
VGPDRVRVLAPSRRRRWAGQPGRPRAPASAATGCSPGANQIALFTSTSYAGTCAVYSTGAYPSVSANGGIGNDSAKSVKVGTGAVAVLHKNPSFGGATDDNWQTFAVSDANLGDNYYRTDNDGDDVVSTVSSLWVSRPGTPGATQVAVFDLANYAGAAVIGQGRSRRWSRRASRTTSSARWSSALVKIYKDTSQGGHRAPQPRPAGCDDLPATTEPRRSRCRRCRPRRLRLGLTRTVPSLSTEIAGNLTGLAGTTYV